MIRGFVDSLRVNALNEARVEGWVCDTDDPSHRLEVRGRIDDRVLGRSIADRSRPDLLANAIGDGYSGFVVALEGGLAPALHDLLIVETRRTDQDKWILLPERRVNGRRAVTKYLQEEAASDLWACAPPVAASEECPVFVVGSARSGTSAVFQSLSRVTRYRGFFEGHVLDVAAAMAATVERHYCLKAEQLPNPYFYHLAYQGREAAMKAVHQALRELTAGYRTLYWADKTPTPAMAWSVPILAATWPNSRFIFMRRRGIENLMSRQRKFRNASFEYNAGDWAATMLAWRSVRPQIPGKYVELEQVDLLREPQRCAASVAALLGLDGQEAEALSAHLSQNRPEVTDPSSRTYGSIEETGWDEVRIATFRRICDCEMAAYHYTYDERYSDADTEGLCGAGLDLSTTIKTVEGATPHEA